MSAPRRSLTLRTLETHALRRSMEWERIRKRPEDCVGANLQDYEGYAKRFAWSQARALLDGLPVGGLNIAHEAVDRHVLAGRGGQTAPRGAGGARGGGGVF